MRGGPLLLVMVTLVGYGKTPNLGISLLSCNNRANMIFFYPKNFIVANIMNQVSLNLRVRQIQEQM
jgi:hypothetical protein